MNTVKLKTKEHYYNINVVIKKYIVDNEGWVFSLFKKEAASE